MTSPYYQRFKKKGKKKKKKKDKKGLGWGNSQHYGAVPAGDTSGGFSGGDGGMGGGMGESLIRFYVREVLDISQNEN